MDFLKIREEPGLGEPNQAAPRESQVSFVDEHSQEEGNTREDEENGH
jgi:hypothetical protein